MEEESLIGERQTSGTLAGPHARDGSGSQGRCQPMTGLLKRRTSQISNTSIDRCSLRVGPLFLELHAEEFKGLYLVPFCQ